QMGLLSRREALGQKSHRLFFSRRPASCGRYLSTLNGWRTYGAGDRFRTDDLVLGKHALYQLSYTRTTGRTNLIIGRVGPSQSDGGALARAANRLRAERAQRLDVIVHARPYAHDERDPQHEHPERKAIDVQIGVMDQQPV